MPNQFNPYASDQPVAIPTPVAPAQPIPSQPTAGTTTTMTPPVMPGTVAIPTPTNTPVSLPGNTPNVPPPQFGAGSVVSDYMNNLTNQDSAYMRNASLRGLEHAASRGNLNGSIGAGASRRASLEAAMPMVNEMVGVQKSRESYAAQDWLSSNSFDREFSASLALLPIKSSYDMLNTLMSYGAENPDVYTPEVMSGMSNFFTKNMRDIMSQYYGGAAP